MIFCKIASDSLIEVKIEIMLKSRSNNHIILQSFSRCDLQICISSYDYLYYVKFEGVHELGDI